MMKRGNELVTVETRPKDASRLNEKIEESIRTIEEEFNSLKRVDTDKCRRRESNNPAR